MRADIEGCKAQVLRLAEVLFMSKEVADHWYHTEPLPEFSGQTAAQAVEDGKYERVLVLLNLYDGGFLG